MSGSAILEGQQWVGYVGARPVTRLPRRRPQSGILWASGIPIYLNPSWCPSLS